MASPGLEQRRASTIRQPYGLGVATTEAAQTLFAGIAAGAGNTALFIPPGEVEVLVEGWATYLCEVDACMLQTCDCKWTPPISSGLGGGKSCLASFDPIVRPDL